MVGRNGETRAQLSPAEVLAAGCPVCYLVEPDAVWAEQAIDLLLEECARMAAMSDPERVVSRWTRARGWVSLSGYGFALAGAPDQPGAGPVRDEIARLAGVLASGSQRGRGPHPLNGAVFSVRGLQPELENPATAEILIDTVRQLIERNATLIIEMQLVPAGCQAWTAAARLGPIVTLSDDPAARYADALTQIGEAAVALGESELAREQALAALAGLTKIQADTVTRLVVHATRTPGAHGPVLDLLARCRERVEAVLAGAGR